MSKKNEKKVHERNFAKEVKDMAERLNVKPKDNKTEDKDALYSDMFSTIHSAVNHVTNLSGYTFTVEEETFDIGEVMHALMSSVLINALIRTDKEWVKKNLKFMLDNFDDLEVVANELLESGQMMKGNSKDFAEFLEAYQGDSNDRVVH